MKLVQVQNIEIPDYHAGGIARYYLQRIPPGGFTLALLKGDLFGAVNRGDHNALRYLVPLAKAVACYIPITITREGVCDWLNCEDKARIEAITHRYKGIWSPYLGM
jgi:hypothetical protein